MLCLDNPEGLTNHPLIGYSETVGRSEARLEYRQHFTNFHQTASRAKLRLKPFQLERPFPAPNAMAVPEDVIKELIKGSKYDDEQDLNHVFDVCIVTDLNFPGGNTSSSIEEYKFLKNSGRSVKFVHCPRGRSPSDETINEKFEPFENDIKYVKSLGQIKCKVLIARHPRVICSSTFAVISGGIACERAFFVINNSFMHSNGGTVYDRHELFRAIGAVPSSKKLLAPISSKIKAELEPYAISSGSIDFSDMTWNPTFQIDVMCRDPRSKLSEIPRIGRHARDSVDKWPEDPAVMAAVYPDSPSLNILHMGGDKVAMKIMGARPGNWTTLPFGALDVPDYLSRLDVFVYFPHSRYKEAFGRTIVEAMLAFVPVILPHSFEETFGEMPLYCEPDQVADLVRRLARDDGGRIAYLTEVQQIAVERFSSRAIGRRLAHAGLPGLAKATAGPGLTLSSGSRIYRTGLIAALGAELRLPPLSR
jgi:glycosyltransferase involved in cell wall biosynthesis